jgi:uncharacterized repeat protein (TIGR02543 family)
LGIGDIPAGAVSSPVKVLNNVVSTSVGVAHSGAVAEDGSLYMWGWNYYGQLGDGTQYSSYTPVKVMDHIKLNTASLLSINPTIKQSSRLKVASVAASEDIQTADFKDLTPNATYTFYVMRDRQSEKPLGSSNLLYITQATADEDGNLSVSYKPTETVSDAEAFVVKSEQEDISDATVSLSNLKYDGMQQYAQPTVTLSGKALAEGEDYELLGDYSAQEIGDYSLTVQGIGAYTGTVAVSYKVYGEGNCPVQSITLNKATASLNPKGTLQLTATVLPEEASNKELSWTSNNSEIAAVDQKGLVTAVAEGTATITAAAQDGSGLSATCVVTVAKSTAGDNGDNGNNSGGGASGGGTSGGGASGGGASGGGSSSGNNTAGNAGDETLQDETTSKVSEASKSVTVTFAVNGGGNLSQKTIIVQQDEQLGKLPTVERKNYIFKGWYTQKSGGEKVTKNTELNESITLYAHWTKVTKPTKVQSLTVKNVKAGKLSVSYKKVSGAKGYEIAYSTNKKFSASSTKKVAVSSTKKILSELKKGKTYYIKVRAYKKDSTGRKIYGTYSQVKTIVAK